MHLGLAPVHPDEVVRLLLLRHGQVASHRGDIPITEEGRGQARRAGAWLAQEKLDVADVLYGGTRRTRETAEQLAEGLAGVTGEQPPPPVSDSYALRNPDLYLGGERVNMVSSAEAFAEQVPELSPSDVLAVPFFSTWLSHPDRVGFWVGHSHPPGDTAPAVARRIEAFARSLADMPRWRGRTVVAVSHSPVLRAVAVASTGTDPGEPPYLHGYSLSVLTSGAVVVDTVAPTA